MNMKTLLSTASLALVIAGASATAQAQIAIGHLADYSGGTSDVGTPYGQAVADTFAWVNKNGGVAGKQLNVDTNDYGYQVPRAIALYKKWSGGDKVAAIMGVEAGSVDRLVAHVGCRGGENAKRKYDYSGIQDCVAASRPAKASSSGIRAAKPR